jgi:outer membrane immunogenic protein
MKYSVNAIIVIFFTAICFPALAQSTSAPSTDVIMQRLDAMDKRNAKLESENAALRERMRLLEGGKRSAAAAVPPSTQPKGNMAAMAMATPAAGVYKAPIAGLTSADYWTGFYVGGHLGGGLAQKKWNDLTPIDPLNNPTFTGTNPQDMGSHNATGLLGGIQAGYNWQFAHWIVGVEGQYSFADLTGDHQNTFTAAAGVPNFFTSGTQVASLATRIDGVGTIAGRIGYASDLIDRTMFYVKGGAAYARDRYTEGTQTSLLVCINNPPLNCAAGGFTGLFSASQDRWGWMGGVGLEYGLTQNWSAKVEYDFLGFGTKNVNMPGTLCSAGVCVAVPNQTVAIDQNVQLLKFGVNYHFH